MIFCEPLPSLPQGAWQNLFLVVVPSSGPSNSFWVQVRWPWTMCCLYHGSTETHMSLNSRHIASSTKGAWLPQHFPFHEVWLTKISGAWIAGGRMVHWDHTALPPNSLSPGFSGTVLSCAQIAENQRPQELFGDFFGGSHWGRSSLCINMQTLASFLISCWNSHENVA